MSLFSTPDDIRAIQNLLYPDEKKDDASDDDDLPARCTFNPGNIGAPYKEPTENEVTAKNTILKKIDNEEKKPQNIEEWQEMQEKEDADILETRQRPEYKMTYRQAVGTEDIYLQMGARTPSSASCEDLVIDIMLPDETVAAEKMQLTITATEIDLASPIYRLKLPLIHCVDVDRCKAKYDSDLKKMTLTLRLKRELDFVNF